MKINYPFFPYLNSDNVLMNGRPAESIIICKYAILHKGVILKTDFTGYYESMKGSYEAKNSPYSLEYQEKYITKDWKLNKGNGLNRIYKISYTSPNNYPIRFYVKLSIIDEFRIKWINKMHWFQHWEKWDLRLSVIHKTIATLISVCAFALSIYTLQTSENKQKETQKSIDKFQGELDSVKVQMQAISKKPKLDIRELKIK